MSHNGCEIILLFIANLIFAAFLPLYLLKCFVVIEPNEAVVFTSFGKIRRVIKDPGCHYNPLLSYDKVSAKMETLQIKGSSVPDQKGSPLNVSVIVNYKIVDPIKALYAVENYHFYLEN